MLKDNLRPNTMIKRKAEKLLLENSRTKRAGMLMRQRDYEDINLSKMYITCFSLKMLFNAHVQHTLLSYFLIQEAPIYLYSIQAIPVIHIGLKIISITG